MGESRTRPKATVDTNLFVSGMIMKGGRPHRLLRRWLDEDVLELLLSDEQEAELTRVFRRPRIVQRYRLAPEEIAELFAGLDTATRAPLSPSLPVTVRDRNDEHILAAALGGNADYLVTGDDDLLSLAGDPRLGALAIVTAAEFLDVLAQPDGEEIDQP